MDWDLATLLALRSRLGSATSTRLTSSVGVRVVLVPPSGPEVQRAHQRVGPRRLAGVQREGKGRGLLLCCLQLLRDGLEGPRREVLPLPVLLLGTPGGAVA